jgi:altronate hydrolase
MDATTQPPVIRLHPDDSVVITRMALPPGTPVGDNIATRQRVPPGHKVAMRGHQSGEAVKRYGQIIGFASQPIAPGDWVHTHNTSMGAAILRTP